MYFSFEIIVVNGSVLFAFLSAHNQQINSRYSLLDKVGLNRLRPVATIKNKATAAYLILVTVKM